MKIDKYTKSAIVWSIWFAIAISSSILYDYWESIGFIYDNVYEHKGALQWNSRKMAFSVMATLSFIIAFAKTIDIFEIKPPQP